MPPSKRMTANPAKPARHRAGKPTGVDSGSDSSDSDSGSDSAEVQRQQKKPAARKPIAPPPKAPSAGKIISTGAAAASKATAYKDEDEARRAAAARARAEAERRAREEGFVTEDEEEGESEEGSGSGESESEESSEEEEEEAPRRLMMRPKFVPKHMRDGGGGEAKPAGKDAQAAAAAEEEEEAARRKAAADALVEEQIAARLAARAAAARRKHWEDGEEDPEAEVDDTDGLDPAAEHAAWKLRELRRVRRDREAVEAREREREEIERRRGLTEDERRAEDEAWIARQREEKDGRGKMAYLQKYFHKGAFYQDESHERGLDARDIMGARFADEVKNRDLLPKALQMRDMTKLGKKGATKYRDLKSEDTGRWGELDDGRQRRGFDRGLDERFQPDRDGGGGGWGRNAAAGEGAKGANAIPLGDRKAGGVPGAPEGPRAERERGGYRPRQDDRDRPRSRSRSPRRDRSDRDGSRERHRDRDDYRERRKRESSRDHDRYESDKRRRVDAR